MQDSWTGLAACMIDSGLSLATSGWVLATVQIRSLIRDYTKAVTVTLPKNTMATELIRAVNHSTGKYPNIQQPIKIWIAAIGATVNVNSFKLK